MGPLLAKRIHSIYVLRMFNDCIAVLLGYLAIYHFTKQKWRLGSFIYSLSVSVKMNMLLYAPGILFLYLVGTGLQETIICLFICAIVQLILGLPFLLTYPKEYLIRSFSLSLALGNISMVRKHGLTDKGLSSSTLIKRRRKG